MGLLVPNRLVLILGSPKALAVLDRYPADFLGADLEARYAADGRKGFLAVLGYIPAIEGIGLSLTKSFIVAASCMSPFGDFSKERAFGSHFLCNAQRVKYRSAICLASSSVGGS